MKKDTAVKKVMQAAEPLLKRDGDKMPKNYWVHHSKRCGTEFRGCAPECPKDTYERTGKWTGPTRRQEFEADVRRAVSDFLGED